MAPPFFLGSEFFMDLKVNLKEAMDFRNRYSVEDLHATIVNFLPGMEFDTMLQAFLSIKVPADLIQPIELYYLCVEGRATAERLPCCKDSRQSPLINADDCTTMPIGDVEIVILRILVLVVTRDQGDKWAERAIYAVAK
ncbi:hypothetical protein BDN71DRAFT_1435293 [Pleurotus eryngii]|uniref:Uncharacterized protein n=1 Tax=Pleurotus eryngii TaxID=5323 RepID=A0A9P6D255_PLEER|nr:hypothetical protein BDN71DRAFT_1435293 [Pleurotus eryngii]